MVIPSLAIITFNFCHSKWQEHWTNMLYLAYLSKKQFVLNHKNFSVRNLKGIHLFTNIPLPTCLQTHLLRFATFRQHLECFPYHSPFWLQSGMMWEIRCGLCSHHDPVPNYMAQRDSLSMPRTPSEFQIPYLEYKHQNNHLEWLLWGQHTGNWVQGAFHSVWHTKPRKTY